MPGTLTRSQTGTFTDARLRAIIPEVGGDFYNLAGAGFITLETAGRWTQDLQFILSHQVARSFQLQFRRPDSSVIALEYQVSSDGTVSESSKGGGINYFTLPQGTRVTLFIDIDFSAGNIDKVRSYISGWGTGAAVSGPITRDRAFSKEGYAIVRHKVGGW